MAVRALGRAAILATCIATAGCSNLSKQEQVAIGGAVVGLAVGLLIGDSAGSAAAGAIVGAAAGAVVGAAIGDYLDEQERQRAAEARNAALAAPTGTKVTWQSERRAKVSGHATATTDEEMTDVETLPEEVRKVALAPPDPPVRQRPAASTAAPAGAIGAPASEAQRTPEASPTVPPRKPRLACRMIEEVVLVEGGEKRFGSRVCRLGGEWVKA